MNNVDSDKDLAPPEPPKDITSHLYDNIKPEDDEYIGLDGPPPPKFTPPQRRNPSELESVWTPKEKRY